MIRTILCIAFAIVTLNTFSQQIADQVKLADLDLSKIEQSWWTAQKNKAINGEVIQVATQQFKNGIGTISRSTITILLKGKSLQFKAMVGVQDPLVKVDDAIKFNALGDGSKLFYTDTNGSRKFVGIGAISSEIAQGSVEVKIKGDGKQLWSSGKLVGGAQPKAIDLDIKNINILELMIDDAGDGVSGDHINFINPILTFNEFKPQLIDANYNIRMNNANSVYHKEIKPLISKLHEGTTTLLEGLDKDWLIEDIAIPSTIFKQADAKEIVLSNGLISRTFRMSPNCATVDVKNLSTGESLVRGVSPEASVTIDGTEYAVGGLDGQREYGYLKHEWLDDMWSPVNSFSIQGFKINEISERIEWKNKRWSLAKKEKLKGKNIVFEYAHPNLEGIKVNVHYNIYDGIPLISKWITVENKSEKAIVLNEFKSEILATIEPESSVEMGETGWRLPNIHVESDYAFHSMSFKNSNKVVHWEKDPRYTSQTNYRLLLPCLLECKMPIGPGESIAPSQNFESFRIWEMPFDSHDRQRKGLATNRFYNLIAPWTTENPLFLHLTTTDEAKVKAAIDQCVETGYEMVILSFGSGLNMEDVSDANIAKFKMLADYAHDRGIELGGYSLLSSRWISDEVDVINPETGKRGGTIHGSSPCLNSQWGIDYFNKLKTFFEKTGFDLLEHDGSYPGQYCASTTHVAHDGLEDSQWKAWKRITDFYKWCNTAGISLNIPDWYYLSGSTKNGIGYREVNWSLPRERQLVLGRQNIYDGTWERTPSMSWTFVPLTQYHGGGAAATIEPLDQHLDAYKAHMMQNYGSGVQACYRGPRLYDTERTKQTVIEVVNWYKEYREILNAPIVHIKRADGRDIDGFLHVNPELDTKGFAMFFNPTGKTIKKKINIPLYYTGLTTEVSLSREGNQPKQLKLNRDYSIELEVELPANGYTWYVLK